ncbi:hypothetical protein JNL27_16505 [bacterium]|nr:hypothetical protein [bacterium]
MFESPQQKKARLEWIEKGIKAMPKITTTQRIRATLQSGEKVFSNEDPQMSGIIARLRKSGMIITSKRNYKGDDQREYVMEYELIPDARKRGKK